MLYSLHQVTIILFASFRMGELKAKKPVRRRVIKAGNSPEPMGPIGGSSADEAGSICGHGSCGQQCAVRYVGPTSSMRDHHALHAARGVTHIWSAAIITGFAIVLTGAIAFNAAQASTERRTVVAQAEVKDDVAREIRKLTVRLEAMDALLKKVADQCLDTRAVTDTEASR